MTSAHSLIADVFFIGGWGLLLVKALTWEELGKSLGIRLLICSAGAFLALICCAVSHYINSQAIDLGLASYWKVPPPPAIPSPPKPPRFIAPQLAAKEASVTKVNKNLDPLVEWQKQTQPPAIVIEPEWEVKGISPGVFRFMAHNIGSSDVADIHVFSECFNVYQVNPIRLRPIGSISEGPELSLPELRKGRRREFAIDFSWRLKMFTGKTPPYAPVNMNVMRLFLKFRRKADGAEFSVTNGYLISNGESVLFNMAGHTRGIEVPMPYLPSMSEVMQILRDLAPR